MTALMVDVESFVRAWLEHHTGVTTVTETSTELESDLPLFQVARIGGGDDGYVLDLATISLHAFDADRIAAKLLAYQGRDALRAARGVVFNGAVVTRVATIGGPSWTPYDNLHVRRVTGTYQVRIKSA